MSTSIEKETSMEKLIACVREPVVFFDREWKITNINKAALSMIGFDPTGIRIEAMIGTMIENEKSLQKIRQLISGKIMKGVSAEGIILTDVKTTRGLVNYVIDFIPDLAHDQKAGGCCVWHAEKQFNNAWLEREFQSLLTLLEHFPEGIFLCSGDGIVTYANPIFKKDYGDIVGKKWYEQLSVPLNEWSWCHESLEFADNVIKQEWDDPFTNRSYIFFSIVIRIKEHNRIYRLNIIHDKTNQEQNNVFLDRDKERLLNRVGEINWELGQKDRDIEEKKIKLKQQSDIIDKLFANTQFLIALLDTNYNYIRVNKAYAESEGRSENEYLGQNYFEINKNHNHRKIFEQVVKTGEPHITYAREFSVSDNINLGSAYFDWSLNPVKDENGEISGLLLILLDVTSRIENEMKLGEAKRLSDIGKLATTVAHELRSPLGVIQGTVYNIKKKSTDEKLIKNMLRIEKKISESEKIINNLLNYSRINEPEKKYIHLDNFIDECIHDITNQFLNSKIKIIRDYDDFRGLMILFDPFQIREVFSNILSNAFAAVDAQSGEIHIHGEQNDSLVVVKFCDNGKGINEDVMDRIFEPFFTQKSKGTGLGLTICKELVNLHQGTIDIKSKSGEGTEVRVSLPYFGVS